jgi:CheY-like chemotaxis protein
MKTIVIVEDQSVLAGAYRNKFQGEGFNVEVALDGEQGFELITRLKPDLVLLDLQLPKLNGLEILKKLRSIADLQNLPVIVLSSLANPASVEEAWQSGATQVLSKFNTSPKRVLESVHASLAAAVVETPHNPEIALASSSALTRATPQAAPSNRRILLVEDNPDLNALLAFLLHRAGHQVTGLSSSAALEQLNDQTFDLFLLGQNCSNHATLSLCKQLRQLHPSHPIIIYSTTALFSEQQEGLSAGATAYLVKPEDLFGLGQIASSLSGNPKVRLGIRAA